VVKSWPPMATEMGEGLAWDASGSCSFLVGGTISSIGCVVP
jgi:hypothetical protein